MNPIRIVLVGKDTTDRAKIARILEYWHDFSRFPMLDGVRRIYRVLYGAGTYKKTHAVTKYDVYDALYKIDPDIWLTYMDSRLIKTTKDVVIPDVRYTYEVQELEERGFLVIRVINNTGKSPKPGAYLRESVSGTVNLQEYFPSTNSPYDPYYQIPFERDIELTKRGVQNMLETLKLY